MASKRTAGVLAAILVFSGSIARASVYRELQDEWGWPTVHDRLVVDPDERRQADVKMIDDAPGAGSSPVSLPNGADALKETYGDWAVECRIVQSAKICSIGQFQYDEQQRALLFSIEIFPPRNGDYVVAITMPFGLMLSDGVRLGLDDRPDEQRGSFATCMQTGCLVPFQFTNSSIEAMKGAKILKVGAKAYGGGKDAIFNASLKGFQAAVERLRILQQ